MKIYTSLLFILTGIKSTHAADYFGGGGLIAKLASVSSEYDDETLKLKNFY